MKRKITAVMAAMALLLTQTLCMVTSQAETMAQPRIANAWLWGEEQPGQQRDDNNDADPMGKQMRIMQEEQHYTDRYIIKYKSADIQVVDLPNVERSAVKAAADVKTETALSSVPIDQGLSMKTKEDIDIESMPHYSTVKGAIGSDVAIGELENIQENRVRSSKAELLDANHTVITLDARVEPDLFIAELTNELGSSVEYIQPDYRMELSDNDLILNIDLSEQADMAADSNESAADDNLPEELLEESPEEAVEEDLEALQLPTINPAELLADTNADIAAAHTIATGEGAVVAILDTGIDITHPDLANSMVAGYDFVNDAVIIYNNEGMAYAHGTHIAGLIAKVAPDASIMPLKVFENGTAYTSDIIRAIDYAEQHGAAIVNCSWGSANNNRALYEAMSGSNMLFICAAGNARTAIDKSGVYPAAFDLANIISVASLNADMGFSYYSNYGAENVDIAMFGRDIESTLPNGEYGKLNGTSMSAGYVSGAAALVLSIDSVKIEDVKDRLKATSYRLSNLQNKVDSGNKLGIYNAVANVRDASITQINPADDFDVHGYEPTPEENWALFAGLDNVQVAAGTYHSAILKEDGSVWTFGNNAFGQLGNESTYDRERSPVKVVGLTNIKAIAAGAFYTLALKTDGTVWAWGESEFGQLGNYASSWYSQVPVQVGPLPNGTAVEEIAAGERITVMITQNGDLYYCGYDLESLIFGGFPERRIPLKVATGVKKADAGTSHIIMLKTDSTVWSLGLNHHGQLGDGTNTHSIQPVQITSMTGATDISCGSHHTTAIKGGEVWACGNNTYGQLGDSTNTSSNVFVPINIDQEITKISAGAFNTFAYSGGENMSRRWGGNEFGQLGDGTTADKSAPQLMQNPIIANVSISATHGIGLDEQNQIWTWGANDYGQLGDGTTLDRFTPGLVTNYAFLYNWDIVTDGSLVAEPGYDYAITGTTTEHTITIPMGYSGTITLNGVSGKSMIIAPGADAELVLQGTNSFTPTIVAENAITVGGTLTISGSGSLTVNPIQNGGSIYVPTGGTLIVNDGTIVANGSNHAAGIGGKRNGSAGVGTIIINGGNVTANGGGRWSGCAGIGTGIPNPGNDTNSAGGTIIITGGTVNATGGYSDGSSGIGGAGIGMGRVAAGGVNLVKDQKIIITGGDITASGGLTASAIGAGNDSAVNPSMVVVLPTANIVSLTADNAPTVGNIDNIFYLNKEAVEDIGGENVDTSPFGITAINATEGIEATADFSAYNEVLAEFGAFSLGVSEANPPSDRVWDLQYYTDMATDDTGSVVFSAEGYRDTNVPVSELAMDNEFAFVLRIGGENPPQAGTAAISVISGAVFELCTTATNIADPETAFKLSYNTNELDLQDIAAQKFRVITATGVYGNLTVLSVSDGEVVFKVNIAVESGKSWSGLLSIFKFVPKITGETVITLDAI